MTRDLRVSIVVYLVLMAYLAMVKLALTFMPNVFRSPAQAAVFAWPAIALFTVLGVVGVYLADRTGFPPALGATADENAKRVWLPSELGIGLGAIAIVTEQATHWTQIVAAKMHLPSIHIAWPASLLIYPGGAVIVEVVYRIFLVPLLLWLISSVILRGRQQERVFWVLAVITALLEPLSQDLHAVIAGPSRGAFAAVFVEDFVLNILQAWLFRRQGFLSAILLRVVFYLVWHVLWGLSGH
jgi:hypothetical protein